MSVGMCMQDPSTRRFRHNVVSVWDTAIGGVCLMLMSAMMAVFAWRIVQARQQNKTWSVFHSFWVLTVAVIHCDMH